MRLLFILSFILLLVGCTITKRYFGPGYHVEWKKSYSKTENEVDRLNITDSGRESSMMPDENEVIIEMISTDTMHRAELISPDQLEISIEEPADFSEAPVQSGIKPLIESNQFSDEEVPVDEPKRRVELFTWISLGSLILAVIFVILSLTIFAVEIPWIFAAVHYFGFVIFSMISVVQVRKNPSNYKGKGLTWTLFGLSLATIVATIGFTVYKIVDFFR